MPSRPVKALLAVEPGVDVESVMDGERSHVSRGVRDEAELQPALAKRIEQCVCRRRELARGLPCGVLGLEKASELLVAHLTLTIERDWHVRFIELMPLGGGECATLSMKRYVSNIETRRRIEAAS